MSTCVGPMAQSRKRECPAPLLGTRLEESGGKSERDEHDSQDVVFAMITAVPRKRTWRGPQWFLIACQYKGKSVC